MCSSSNARVLGLVEQQTADIAAIWSTWVSFVGNMDLITKSPGLSHVAENIFLNLNHEDLLLKCQAVNPHWKNIIRNHWFWFKACEQKGIFKEKEENESVKKFLVSCNRSNIAIEFVTPILITMYSGIVHTTENLPQPSDTRPRPKFNSLVYTEYIQAICEGNVEIVKNVAPLFQNPNQPGESESTPICWAAFHGHLDILKILITLTNDPNFSPKDAIGFAARRGHSEVVKFLAPFSKGPNVPDAISATTILEAVCRSMSIKDKTDIVRVLAPLTKTPNHPDENGQTPIHIAATFGYTEIVRILAPLSKNLNDKNKEGLTPMYMAALYGHSEITKILYENWNSQKKEAIALCTIFTILLTL